MYFNEIVGQDIIKNHLVEATNAGRIPHAQLFVGLEGSGTLPTAIAYAQHLLCDYGTSIKESCSLKFKSFSHPDLHFIFPTVSTDDVKSKPKSIDFIKQWRQFLTENPYGNIFDWYKLLDVKNKQGSIRVDDAQEILKTLSLKSYEGGYKVMIIWMADKLNIEASNKLLKLLEEPTDKTVLILVSENEEDIIQTIRSRCQILHFNALTESDILTALVNIKNIEPNIATKIARQSQGSFNKALQLLQSETDEDFFEKWFIDWVRAAFKAKGRPEVILELISWSEQVATLGRETQKRFLNYCINMFREALLLHYKTPELVYFEPKDKIFKLQNLAPFVNDKNIFSIFNELSDAIFHIERNGNAKIILTDLSIKLTRLIHKK